MANVDAPEDAVPGQPAQASPAKPRASIHDTYVYRVLSDPRMAAAVIKTVLAKEVADEIDWDKLELDPSRYATTNLDNQYPDLLYRTTIRGRNLRIRLLIEHSSHPKALEPLQTLQYQVHEWEREASQQRASDGPQRLTPIITIIFHHSESGWRGRTRFMDYFGLDEELAKLLRPYVVDFGIVLDDISKTTTEMFVQRPVPLEVRIFLIALRYAREGEEVLQELRKIKHLTATLWQHPQGQLAIRLFIVYIVGVAKVKEADVRDALQEFIEPYLDPEMVAVWTQYEAGEKQGELRGERKTLQRLLTQRFGPLSSAQLERLESASLEQLDAMTLRVLTAASIEEVLGVRGSNE